MTREEKEEKSKTLERKMQKIELTGDPSSPVFGHVFIDGMEIDGVTGFRLIHTAGNLPVLTLDINVADIYINRPMILWNKDLNKQMKIETFYPTEEEAEMMSLEDKVGKEI